MGANQKKENKLNVSALKQSKFLTQVEVGKGTLLTIREIVQDNVAKEGAPEELKHIMFFEELEKGLVLNSTNGNLIASFLGDETDDWTGHQVVLYSDPSIMFGGKRVGGIRCRQPRNQATSPMPQTVRPAPARPAARQASRPEPQPAPELLPEGPGPDNQDGMPF